MAAATRRFSGEFFSCIGILIISAFSLMGCGGGSANNAASSTNPATSIPSPSSPSPSASQPGSSGSSNSGSSGAGTGTGAGSGSGSGSSSTTTSAIAYVNGGNNNFYGIRVDGSSNVSTVSGSPYALPGRANSFASTGNLLYVASVSANFTTGTISSFHADSNGALSRLTSTPLNTLGASAITIDSTGKFLYASANSAPGPSGSQNAVYGFAIDQNSGALSALAGSPWYLTGGMGPAQRPRVSANGSWFCVDMELARTNEGAQCYPRHSDGSIDGGTFVQPAVSDTSICGLAITADSTHMIYTNCQQSVFSTLIQSANNGTPTPSGGSGASEVAIDPTGRWLVLTNASSGNIGVFSVAPGDGLAAAGTPVATGSRPDHIAFSRSGTYIFVTSDSGTMVFSFNPSNGAVAALNAANPAPGISGELATM
ncbi:MAG: beta-propeller fold lactonase family protein [Acidobacteria bacterium]|nr:beta-propeller fold lactonase family protein [Acidobacteriota bacterium]